MKLSETAIRRPVLSWVVSIVIIVMGIVGYRSLQVREYPDIDLPVVTVQVIWPGASPDLVETEVIDRLEEEINTIEGIRTLRSESREQLGLIIVEFRLSRDVDVAAQDVRDAVARTRPRLPDDVLEPVVQKFDLGAQAIMWLGLNSTWMNQVQLSEYADRFLKDRLQILPGVGRILIGGEQRFAVRIDPDPQALAARGLGVADIATVLRRENVELPSGRLEGPDREIVVRTRARLPEPEDFARLILRRDSAGVVTLGDVAKVRRGVENERTLARFMGEPAVGLGVFPQSRANVLEVADAVRAEVERLRSELPPGVSLETTYDVSRFIRASVDDTMRTLLVAGILVVLVIFLFLRSLRSSMVPAIVIPVAVVGTFAFMYFLDFTINQVTLLGLILAIGLLVDDAIVMLENIYRHMEEKGEARMEAAYAGSKEIAFAIIASSISLFSIFLPVAFITGIIGEFMFEFGITVAAAVGLSTFIALTLTPMLCARILRVSQPNRVSRFMERGFLGLTHWYDASLRAALSHRWLVVLLAIGAFGSSFFFLNRLSQEFQPPQDQGTIIVVGRAPEGATLAYTDRALREMEAIVAQTEEVETFFSSIGLGAGGTGQPNQAIMFISLVDRRNRDRDQFEIMAQLRAQAEQIPGMQFFLQERSPFGGGGQTKPFQMVIQHPDLTVLADTSEALMRRLRAIDGFVDVDSDLELNRTEYTLRFDRDLAAEMGISALEIGQTLQILIGGVDVTRFTRAGREYNVIVQLADRDRRTLSQLEGIHVRTAAGKMVPLATLLYEELGVGPTQINHYNRQRAVTVNANLDGIALGDSIRIARALSDEVLPADASLSLAGEAADLGEAFEALFFTFLLAIALIYLVLAAQFESWLQPFIIMLGLPLSFVGAFGALWLSGNSMSIFSFIGLILLVGLVTKNGILLIDNINQQLARGREREEAVRRAGHIRFRPILMTAFTTIFSLLPVALGLGAGAESRAPLGVVVVGGMLVSTLLTLIVVPVVYTLLDDLREKVASWLGLRVRTNRAGSGPERNSSLA